MIYTVSAKYDIMTLLPYSQYDTKYNKGSDPDRRLDAILFEMRILKEGRWISRDPIGEAGGMGLYVVTGNNLINNWDYLGFKWIIERKGEARGKTCANSEKDTLLELANELGLLKSESKMCPSSP